MIQSSQSSFVVSDMQSTDLAEVVRIECNAHISPWGRISFEESLNQGHSCRCVWLDDRLVAYSVLQQVVDELHILNVVVTPSKQGQGLAHSVLDDVFSIAQDKRIRKIFLEVRESNIKAQSLYKKWGFELLSVRQDYYRTDDPKVREDALIFVRSLQAQVGLKHTLIVLDAGLAAQGLFYLPRYGIRRRL